MIIPDAGKQERACLFIQPDPWGWGVESWRRLSYYGEPLTSVNWPGGTREKGRKNPNFRVG